MHSVQSTSTDLAPFHEVFGLKQKLPSCIIETVREYIPEDEMGLLNWYAAYVNPLPRFINLTDSAILRNHLARRFETTTNLVHAMIIARRIYEVHPRSVAPYGWAFCMHPEVFSYAMWLAKNEVAVEIAGASGEHAVLLAFAGAERVYMNDITPREVRTFRNLCAGLPFDVSRRLEAIQGSCFDLPRVKPELFGRVGLIVCRNLIHFFNDKRQIQFFDLLKTLLRPGGRAILTASSVSFQGEIPKVSQDHPNVTSFTYTSCSVLGPQQRATHHLFNEVRVASERLVSPDVEVVTVCSKLRSGRWLINYAALHTLPPEVQSKVVAMQAKIQQIQLGVVTVYTSHVRLYSQRTLSDLVKNHGFEVETTFATAGGGHLVLDGGQALLVGVILRRP